MKKFLDAMTTAAMVLFLTALNAIESMKPAVLAALMISGGWLVAYAVIYSELRRAGKWND